ncbi:MAG: hypothetical protein Q8R85_21920 [Bosea sp. (in: a-proteobacteria)]|uniref:hypothetical protein n=1 Tax=Bosea sp. (in: a-proteobacteria) TaxID=1871050 RepID=UPI002732D1B5|nr:hypothetical protein [Bosea sp. (in: a-proteobacteria)]MDP3603822.1 hypothetical protein [Bosea sp. (in: a-proteobacteria)]
MRYLIRIADDALESLALAAIEAYCLGDGQGSAFEQVETLGYLWGHRKFDPDLTTIFIVKASVSISAHRGDSYVIPHPQALLLKDNFVARWSPHLAFLGEFHSHPFDDVASVRQARGFEFSEQDVDSFVGDGPLWARSDNNPLMLAVTVCRLSHVRASWCSQPRANVFSFSVGEFRFWLNARVGFADKNGDRYYTEERRSAVILDLNSRYFNLKKDRIHEFSG